MIYPVYHRYTTISPITQAIHASSHNVHTVYHVVHLVSTFGVLFFLCADFRVVHFLQNNTNRQTYGQYKAYILPYDFCSWGIWSPTHTSSCCTHVFGHMKSWYARYTPSLKSCEVSLYGIQYHDLYTACYTMLYSQLTYALTCYTHACHAVLHCSSLCVVAHALLQNSWYTSYHFVCTQM